jgi:hypothetical protein
MTGRGDNSAADASVDNKHYATENVRTEAHKVGIFRTV